jgi:hypothetical protein
MNPSAMRQYWSRRKRWGTLNSAFVAGFNRAGERLFEKGLIAFARVQASGLRLIGKIAITAEWLKSQTTGRVTCTLAARQAESLSDFYDALRPIIRTKRSSVDPFEESASSFMNVATHWVKGHVEWVAMGITMTTGIVVIIAVESTSIFSPPRIDLKSPPHKAISIARSENASKNAKGSSKAGEYKLAAISNDKNLTSTQSTASIDSVRSAATEPQAAAVLLSNPLAIKNAQPYKQEQPSVQAKVSNPAMPAVRASAPQNANPVTTKEAQKVTLADFHRDALAAVLSARDVQDSKQSFIACRKSKRAAHDINESAVECGVSLPAGTKLIVANTRVDKGICVRFLDDTVCYWPTGDRLTPSKPMPTTSKHSHQVKTGAPNQGVRRSPEDDQLGFLFERQKDEIAVEKK